jgi:hypothetical protein
MNKKKRIILIHAHRNLEHLNRLIKAVDYPNFVIYVNLDKKSEIDPKEISDRAILIKKRVSVVWGEYSITEETLNSLHQIVEEQFDFSHVVLISGQDYPVKSNEEIDDFFEKNTGKNFMECLLITETNKYSPYIWRYDRKHFPSGRVWERKIHTLWKLTYKFFTGKEYKIEMINNYTPYWGSQWWNLTKECVEYVLEKAEDKKITTFFTTTWCSDEVFFQVLLMNSFLKDTIVNDDLRCIDWTNCKNSPRNLNNEDYDKIISSGKLFCRKIETGVSGVLVEKLESNRNSK